MCQHVKKTLFRKSWNSVADAIWSGKKKKLIKIQEELYSISSSKLQKLKLLHHFLSNYWKFSKLWANRWVFRLKFNGSTRARTLATDMVETFRCGLLASSVELGLRWHAVGLVEWLGKSWQRNSGCGCCDVGWFMWYKFIIWIGYIAS